ncbi:Serine proteases trypsin domain [Trinorchestia longiramus]|nr:Serine proteases trypsin domain [Trinorchestia longiramus]
MKTAIVLALLVVAAAAAPDGGWSWGSEEKKGEKTENVVSTPVEQGRALAQHFNTDGNILNIPASDFVDPLPLEPHSPLPVVQQAQLVGQVSQVDTVGETEQDRQARFLGISDKLCDWGVGIRCDNKIKKKGHGYPPSINSQYGAPPQTYETYGNSYGSYVPEQTLHHKTKGHKKGGGVSDLISGFFNSYTKPKHEKGYKPTKLPTYLPPSGAVQGGYGVPVYVAEPIQALPTYGAPQPSYAPPIPSYDAPKPHFNTPKPIYQAPYQKKGFAAVQSSYADTSFNAPVAVPVKPKYVPAAATVTSIFTRTVAPIDATKVQHLHSHTHVYHGAQVIKPGDDGYVDTHHSPSNSYSTNFKKKSDDSNNNVVVSNSGATSFSTSNSAGSGLGSGSNGFVSGHSQSSGFNTQHISSSNGHINSANPFDSHATTNFGNSGNGGFSSHTKFVTQGSNQHNSFHGQGFQPPTNSEFGFKPSLTIEDMIQQNHLNQFSRTIYRTDCHCVAEQYCSADNVVRADRDLTHIIDARNRQDAIYSNATSAENDTDVNSSFRDARTLDFTDYEGDSANATEVPEYYELYEDEEIANENATEVPVARRRRDTNATLENFSDVQGRQLTGYTPGPQGCALGTVCCRRPVYNPARALPVCGISNDENIHGRIKTKDHETGRAGFGEYPWQAAILRRAEGEVVYVCGATLINQHFLITAAHCIQDIDPSLLKIRLGEWDVRDKSEFYPYVEFEVSGVYSHPEFYEGNLENDIAILRTDRLVDYTKYPHISPVCMPASRQDFSGQVCRITGWGKDGWGSEGNFQSILKETQVPVVNSNICQQILRTTKLGSNYKLPAGMICAGGEENKDACKGDGGGPLVCRGAGGEFQLAGVVSWGLGCGQRGIPGVYVDIPHYIDWINSIVGF